MKQFFLLVISSLAVLFAGAQKNTGAATVTVMGTKDLKVSVDGKNHVFASNAIRDNKATINLNNLKTGQHVLLVSRTDINSNKPDKISPVFNLRYGYNMLVMVNANGSLELIETKLNGINTEVAMNDVTFNNLVKNIKRQQSVNGRRSLVANAFNNAGNHFTVYQVVEFLQLINSESYRLQLAKSSYRTVVDKNNFTRLYGLLNNKASRSELEEYVREYNVGSNGVAMSDDDFIILYRDLRTQSPGSTQMSSLVNTFNSDSYFTTTQVKQLLPIVTSESNMLQLAKLSYRNVVDKENFNELYFLLNSQQSQDELKGYVNNYKADNNFSGAMPDAGFTALYNRISSEWPTSMQMKSLRNAFNSNQNNFTTEQVRQLITLVTAENSRLQLAKLSYRTIVDTVNFDKLYYLFNDQSSRTELDAYVNNYNSYGIVAVDVNSAMTDTGFDSLYMTIQPQFFPNEKMKSLTNAFNNTGYYFTSEQARRLTQLVSLESNRLQLAKLSYRTITDRSNFSLLYDLFNNQASRNELDAYVKAYKE